ncbi:MAG: beta-lactamase family protein [Verrucomicrobia bacterium]|nr:beta-lactamase family protein [Verrucomicrobiota bacterium]
MLFFPALSSAQSDFSSERLERLRHVISESVEHREYAGVDIVVAQHGKTVISGSFGYQDFESRKAMQPDTIFAIASMTKPITAVAVMMLYEEGKFLLEEPVSKYLPEFANMQVLATEGGDQTQVVPAASQITIRQLLTHTDGLFNFKGYAAAGVGPQLSLAATVKKIATVPLSHQPGQAWRYGVSYEVLARLVEVCSGQPYDVFLSERLFRPLDMKDTGFFVPADKAGRLAKGYKLNEQHTIELLSNQGAPDHKPVYVGGSGGLYSTTGDFLRFSQMLLNGGTLNGHRILSPVTVDYMMQNHVPLNVLPPDGPNGRKGFGHGLGGYVLLDPPAYEDLSVKGEFNGAGVGGTFYWIDRKNDLIGLWFAQRYPQVQTTLKRFKVLTYQALEK